MLVLSLNYSDILQRNSEQIKTAQNEFNNKLKLLTGNELLDTFVEQKKTGTDRPGNKEYFFIHRNSIFISKSGSTIRRS
jgi:hypothetical protein